MARKDLIPELSWIHDNQDIVVPGQEETKKGWIEQKVYEDGTTTKTFYVYGNDNPVSTKTVVDDKIAARYEKPAPSKVLVDPTTGQKTEMGYNPETGEYDKPMGAPVSGASALPGTAALDAQREAERDRNLRDPEVGTGRYETNAEKEERLQKAETQRQTLQAEADRVSQARAQLDQALQIHKDTISQQEKDRLEKIAEHGDAQTIAQATLDLNQKKFDQEKIDTQFTHGIQEAGLTGQYNGQDTLAKQDFDLRKAQGDAQAKREELKLDIDMHKATAEDAAAEYKRWYDQNITAPLQAAQERRLQADTQLNFQKALDQQNQFAATNSVQRNQVAFGVGQNAAENELKLLPYRVGPGFSGHMADAINSVAQGSSAGVHFDGSDFTFKAPDLQGIARKATAEALSHISPYAKSQMSAPDMGGFSMPDFSGAPAQVGRYVPPVSGGGSGTSAAVAPPPDTGSGDDGIGEPTMGPDEG